MTSVVQAIWQVSSASPYTGSFAAAPAVGDTVILLVTGVNSSTISSSAPLWGGNAVPGAVKMYEVYAGNMYSAAWMLPAVGDGSTKSFSLTVTNGQDNNNVGTLMLDVSGLGSSPTLDATTTPTNSASGASTTPASGSTTAISGSSDIIVGCASGFSTTLTGPGGWSNTLASSPGSVYGYQLPGSSGGTYNYNPTASPSGAWTAGVAAISAGGSGNTVTVTNPGSQFSTSGVPIAALQLVGHDSANGQTLTFTASGLPAGLSISSGGLVSGTPTTPGAYVVTVTATDGTGAHGSTTFAWVVNHGVVLSGTTSRTVVRHGIAQYFGGTYQANIRAYVNGPLLSNGLVTVRAGFGKRLDWKNMFNSLSPGRGMGTYMIVTVNQEQETRNDNTGAFAGAPVVSSGSIIAGGIKLVTYKCTLECFHLAQVDYAEDAQDDIDAVIEAIKELLRQDRTLGAVCTDAGETRFGLRVTEDYPGIDDNDRTATHFTVQFEVRVQIVA